MKIKVLTIAVALFATFATPAFACSIGRMRPIEIHARQVRDLREADLVFIARVVNHGVVQEGDDNVVIYEPIGLVSGEGALPDSLAIAVFYCLPLPQIGETQVILMRSSDLSEGADRTSPVLGYYDLSDIYDSGLIQRVDRALRRANIQ